jgi:hypothetical protein
MIVFADKNQTKHQNTENEWTTRYHYQFFFQVCLMANRFWEHNFLHAKDGKASLQKKTSLITAL